MCVRSYDVCNMQLLSSSYLTTAGNNTSNSTALLTGKVKEGQIQKQRPTIPVLYRYYTGTMPISYKLECL